METVNAVIFYILSAICLVSGIFCMFQKETINAVISAVVFFWGISGFYFLLKAPYLGCVQILVWGVGVGILMLFSVMMTNKKDDEKQALPEKNGAIDMKSIAAPVVGVVFAILILPFILYQFGGIKTAAEHPIQDFAAILYKNNAFGFELTGILLFAAIAGICTVIISKAAKSAVSRDIKLSIAKKEKGEV